MDNKNNNSRSGIVIGLLIISLLMHVFFSKNPSLVGALETFGIVSLIFICLHLVNIIADNSKTKDFFTKYYGVRVKKILSPFYIILGILTFLGFMYLFSFHGNRSFDEYFRFVLAMAGVVVLGGVLIMFFFGVLPGVFNFVYKHTEKFLNNSIISFIIAGIAAILAFLALVLIVIFLDKNNYFDKINWVSDNYLFK